VLTFARMMVWTNLLLVGIEIEMMQCTSSAWVAWTKELSFGSLGVIGDLAGDRTGCPFHLRSEN
jgi:hypothetical protein